jgi:hypothetical protein
VEYFIAFMILAPICWWLASKRIQQEAVSQSRRRRAFLPTDSGAWENWDNE